MKPEISIIIPCYNHGEYVREAIESVLKSTVIEICEIIVVNDGSTDPYTIQVIQELENEGIKVINQQNQGLGRTRNNGIRIAKGKYILPLDADNTISPDFIENVLAVFEIYPSESIIYTDREFFGKKKGIDHVGNFDLERMMYMNYIDACAIYRKEVWEKIGGYDENMPIMGWEDWDFWLSAAEQDFKFHYIPKPLFQYRVVENSMLQELQNNLKYEILVEYINKKHIRILYKSYQKVYPQFSISMFEKQHPLRTFVKYIVKWLLQKH
ncbi:MAG: glycosyltransferase family A protein [Prolixibacteraceae bacterium]|nr:glycosyltransferase family A protein [Prolixibacteraceae bacterium]